MNWNWQTHLKMNSLKVLFHIIFETTVLATWYLILEGDPVFWPLGIASAFAIHVIVFTKLDLLHELHHHHSKSKGHPNHGKGHLAEN
jgi:hypothetical protein